MSDRHHEHEHGNEHTHEKDEAVSEIVRLRKMVEHWISHNEEHARSYRLWASRAREAGCEEPGEILEEIASEIQEQNERFMKIVHIIDSSGRPD
jgi:rubrerythrin